VRAGFLAAAAAAKVKAVVIGHGDDDVLTAFNAAKEGGARVIVGPLVRDDLKKLSAAGLDLPATIALNQLDDSAQLPPNFYTLTLTLDSDARQLAHRARDAGAMTVAVIASDSSLQQRFAAAFNAEWILAGGDAPTLFRFDRSPEVLRSLRNELIKTRVDAALLAIDGADVALAKSYIKSTPTYTSNQVNENLSREARFDLDDVQFVDIPWLVDPDGAAYAGLKRPDYPNATLDRLYALGIDAFRVAQAFVDGAPDRLDFDGATGRLSLDSTRQFMREGRMMVFRSGQVVSAQTR
jgi:outer membrane PBP1 activator LpoA protein